jgi:hypothetical protein
MDDPRANMHDNRLTALGAPTADWTRTPGRTLGFWLTAGGVLLTLVVPILGLILAGVGASLSMRAYRVIPAGARGRGLTLAALALMLLAILAVVLRPSVAAYFVV